jgi:hypothetical protein
MALFWAAASPVAAAGPAAHYRPASAAENRLVLRCMRSKGLPARWGRRAQPARVAWAELCTRELFGR